MRGLIELSFEGEQEDGSLVRLDLPTVSVKKTTKRQKFGFKYFQNFEGNIKIPENFTPMSMYIKVAEKLTNTQGRRSNGLGRSFCLSITV